MKKKMIASLLLAGATVAWAATYASTLDTSGSSNPPGWERGGFGAFQGHPWGPGFWGRHGGKGMEWPGVRGKTPLTDAEKTALQSMDETQRRDFFEKKRTEAEAKREAHEAVIDKLIDWQALTDAEKVTLAEIKAERAEMKAKRAEMEKVQEARKKTMETLKPIFEKIKNKEVLTSEEQKQLYDAQASFAPAARGQKGPGGPGGPADQPIR